MRLRAIPPAFLRQNALLLRREGEPDAWGKRGFRAVELQRVFYQVEERAENGKPGEREGSALLLFFDAIHSLPRGTDFQPGDRIEIGDGRERLVVSVSPCGAAGRLHHIEVEAR
ncbi:MAG: hypothetical protein FWE85_03125 [Clostridiales bacterium]|nr:hypothetical protein [Clostridiales bacterium]